MDSSCLVLKGKAMLAPHGPKCGQENIIYKVRYTCAQIVRNAIKGLILKVIFNSSLEEKAISSKLDLRRVYFELPMEEEEIAKAAVVISVDLFKFLYMPFGLKNATQTFQRFINSVLEGLNCFPYLQDILVALDNEESHLRELKNVFEKSNCFELNKEKYILLNN
ncbi:transposon Ty3-G Gag-Pol polyprotein [Trichonephila inaurata madagascariensis]|uniref:Transposon Ty3-G Gag-Pol polyprotein n=1 Tax=Trichonephila inaurata madagascariensis TaxID=2747483 RepID=A0A8X6WSJ1_9ARAC|nr:transposon Ty3-G Gag-Pol polyprotein [Trichonephila inaurata madagascariensis]